MDGKYLTSAAKAEQLPAPTLPEIAFVGRSNSGKSTLINALANQKNLARSSRTPGRTQMVNFFLMNDKKFFVDLPGYGFSGTGGENRQYWFDLMKAYFERQNIEVVIFIIDIRREFDSEDLELLKFLSTQHPVLIALSKADKLGRGQQARHKELAKLSVKKANLSIDMFWVISSPDKLNIEELRKQLMDGITS